MNQQLSQTEITQEEYAFSVCEQEPLMAPVIEVYHKHLSRGGFILNSILCHSLQY